MADIKTFTDLHEVWVSYAMKFTRNVDDANDLTQELYIKLLKLDCLEKICKNGKVNRSWVYVTIRNMFLDGKRNEPIMVEMVDRPNEESEYDFQKDVQIDQMLNIIKKQGNDPCASYHNKHLMLYVFSGKPLRKIADEMGLTKEVIYNAIKNAKRRIKEEYREPSTHDRII